MVFKCMTSSLGTMGKTKTSLFGVKNYRIELKICTLVEDRKLYNIFRFFENFENFGFCDHFSKKRFFEIFVVKTPKFKKSEIVIL